LLLLLTLLLLLLLLLLVLVLVVVVVLVLLPQQAAPRMGWSLAHPQVSSRVVLVLQ
jgi:hypothetical protein